MPLAVLSSSPYLTVAQAAGQIGVHRKTIYEWIKRGALVARVLPGGEYRLERSTWEVFLDSLPTSQPRAANIDHDADTLATDFPPPRPPRLGNASMRRRTKGERNFFAIGANEA